jgi:hypothetical protein
LLDQHERVIDTPDHHAVEDESCGEKDELLGACVPMTKSVQALPG